MNHRLNRRQLIHLGTALAGVEICKAGERTTGEEQNKQTYREAARDVPIIEQADVVVCGAGPAGVAAAIAAAKSGAKARLIEANGCLGGVWTAGLLCLILDMKDKPGLLVEITSRIKEQKAGYVNQPAAGVTAAIAAKTNRLPQKVEWGHVKTALVRFNATGV